MLGARDMVTVVHWDTGTRHQWMGHQIDTFSEMSSTINCEHWCDIGGHCDTGHCDDTMLGPGTDLVLTRHHGHIVTTTIITQNYTNIMDILVCFSGFKPPRLVMLGCLEYLYLLC